MSIIPLEVSNRNKDKQILRTGMIAELDTASLYEQMADKANTPQIKNILLGIAKEEKTHTGEFLHMLKEIDKETEIELQKGSKEAEKLERVVM